jgi:hypothetical protein
VIKIYFSPPGIYVSFERYMEKIRAEEQRGRGAGGKGPWP